MVQEERDRKGNRPQFVTQEIQRTMYLCSNSLFGYIQLFSYLTIVQPRFPVEHKNFPTGRRQFFQKFQDIFF